MTNVVEPTRVPSIPEVSGVKEDQVRRVLARVKELLEVREGVRGDPLDRSVTFRDLYVNGMLNVGSSGQPYVRIPTQPLLSLPAVAGASVEYTPPPAVTGLSAAGALANVVLTFDEPQYYNHAYTEVWRSGVDDLGTAILVGTTDSSVYADSLGQTALTRYYWVRNVSQAGVFGPFNAVAGTAATTGLVVGGDITDASITTQKLADGAVVTAKLGDAAVTTSKIGDSQVSTAKIADAAVTTQKVGDGAVTTIKIGDLQITEGKIAGNAVTTTKITDDAITTPKIAALAVVAEKIAAGAIVAGKIAANAIVAGDGVIANAAIGTALIQDAAIVNAKIGLLAVDTAQIANAAIVAAKIADATITTAKIGLAQITTALIADAAITNAKIGDAEITNAKIANATIEGGKIAASTITADKMSVTTLSAISAKLGDITGGTLDIGSGRFKVNKHGTVTLAAAPHRMSLDGTNDSASTPDSAAVSITGDLSVRIKAAMTDWTPAAVACLVAKWGAAGQRSYKLEVLTDGKLRLSWTTDGTTVISKDSTVAPTVTNGAELWVMATHDVDNGAAGNDVKFWTSADGVSWTQLGTTVTTGGTTSHFDSTAALYVGSESDGATGLWAGKALYADVRAIATTAGSAAAKCDTEECLPGDTTWVSGTSETWTLNNGATVETYSTTGARMELTNNVIKVYDATNTLRVKIGDLS